MTGTRNRYTTIRARTITRDSGTNCYRRTILAWHTQPTRIVTVYRILAITAIRLVIIYLLRQEGDRISFLSRYNGHKKSLVALVTEVH